MAFKTWAAGDVLTAADVNDYLMEQAVIVCTSGTRPSSPTTGMHIFETDTVAHLYYTGSAWRPLSGPYVNVRKTTGLPATIATGSTWTSVQWSVADVETDASMWDVANPTRLVAPIAGWYQLLSTVGWSASSATGSFISAIVNGNTTNRWRGNSLYGFTHTGAVMQSLEAEILMAVGDYVEVQLIALGASASLNAHDNQTPWASLKYTNPA